VLFRTFSSSAPSSVIPQLIEEFNISKEVSILTISLFLAGYCVGPLLWGPLSEQYGRRPIFVSTFFVYMVFQIGSSLSKNAATILVMRFLAGTFAAAPLTNSGYVEIEVIVSAILLMALQRADIGHLGRQDSRKSISRVYYCSFRWTSPWPHRGWLCRNSRPILALGLLDYDYFRMCFCFSDVEGYPIIQQAGVCWVQIVFTIPETYVYVSRRVHIINLFGRCPVLDLSF